jgi:hypothetical protein
MLPIGVDREYRFDVGLCLEMRETAPEGASLSPVLPVPYKDDTRRLRDPRRIIRGSVVDDDDTLSAKISLYARENRFEAIPGVVCRNNGAEFSKHQHPPAIRDRKRTTGRDAHV